MMISTRGRYALRVMIDLAEHATGTFTPLKEVAQRQDISQKYLESIMSNLSKSGFVEGAQGKGGGYRLSRAPEDYKVGRLPGAGKLSGGRCQALRNSAALPDPAYVDPFKQRDQ